MKNKLVHSSFDPISGLSYVVIRNKFGTFVGESNVQDEDTDIISSFLGCRIAESKAITKSLKAKKKILKIQLHTLQNFLKELESNQKISNEDIAMSKLKKKVKEKETEVNTLAEKIKQSEQLPLKMYKEKKSFSQRFNKVKYD